MSKTHFKKLTNQNFLGSWSLDGEVKTFIITDVKREMVKNAQGEEEVVVIHLQDEKPMIANMTNLKQIAALYGPYIEDWKGKAISLHTEKVRAFGTVTDAVRVMDKVVEEAKVPCEECGQLMKAAFGMSVEDLAKYTKNKYGKVMCSECATKASKESAE